MAGVYKGLTIKFNADTTSLSKALDQIDSKGRSVDREMRAINKALKFDTKSPELVRQKMAAFGKETRNVEERLKVLKEAEKQIGARTDKNGELYDALQRDIARTEGKLQSLKSEWQSFTVQTAASNTQLGNAGRLLQDCGSRLSPIAKTASSVGRAMTLGVTVPIVAAGAASIAAATDIDSALTNVRKTVDGTEEKYQQLKEAAIEFSKTNAVSASEVLNIQALGAQLGFQIDELEEFGRVVAGLKIATNLSADEAATQLAQFFNIMGTGHGEISNFASALIDVGNNFATTEADVMAMSMNIAGAAKAIGMSESDVLGFATALTSVGIKAEMGGTAISTIMSQIDMDVAKGGEALSDWASTANMSAEQFASAWKSSPAEAFQSFLAGLQQAASQEGNNISVMLDELGVSSLRQLDTMKRLAGAADLVPKAIESASAAYQENAALTREVANFNESLSSKFEMLGHRVTAIAEQIGAPLADALLDLIDLAEPLFEAIESGARTFSSMSEGEQRVVVATVALIAAIGPALKIFGGIAGQVEVLGRALTKTSEFIAQMGAKSIVAKGGMEALGTTTDKQINRMGRLAIASNLAKGALVGLAIAGIAALGSAIADAVGKTVELSNATTGLESAVSSIDEGVSVASESLDSYKVNADEVIKKQSELADSVKSTFSETAKNSALADLYASKIKELAGNCDGSASKLAELRNAIEKYNEITGSSISITDDETGAIDSNTEKLDANTEAWKRNAKAKARQKVSEDLAEQVAQDEAAVAAKKREISDLAQSAQEKRAKGDAWGAWLDDLSQGKAQEELAKLERALDSSTKAFEDNAAAIDEQSQADSEATNSAAAFREELENAGMSASALDDAAKATGTDAATLASAMHDAGMSAETFGHIGADAFSALYSQAGMDIPAIIELVSSLDGLSLDPKQLSVNDDGSIAYAGQAIKDIDSLEISDKDYVVNDDGTVSTSKYELASLDYVRIGNKVYEVKAEGTQKAINEAQDVSSAVNGIPPSHDTSITATDNTGNVFETIASKIAGLPSFISTSVSALFGQDRAGGFFKLHSAGGFITNGVTPLGRDQRGVLHIAGEDGHEWIERHADGTTSIVPIENERYLKPYADRIAGMIDRDKGSSTVINNNISMTVRDGDDANAVADALVRKMKLRASMGGNR